MPPKRNFQPTPVEFTVTVGNRSYGATYTLEKGCITVVYWGPDADRRQRSTQLGGHASAPEALARRLLLEMISQDPA